jgi:predicted ATP-dependent serine protease
MKEIVIKTGTEKLDDILKEGLKNKGLYLISAYEGLGTKTASKLTKIGKKVLFFSLETGKGQVGAHLIRQGQGNIPFKIEDKIIIFQEMKEQIVANKVEVTVIDFPEHLSFIEKSKENQIAQELKLIAEKLKILIICTLLLPHDSL